MDGKFPWGKIIGIIELVLDDKTYEITKFHPWVREGARVRTDKVDDSVVEYSCGEIHRGSDSLDNLVIHILVDHHLGANNDALAEGFFRALKGVIPDGKH